MKDKTKEFTNFIKQDFDIVEDYKESKDNKQSPQDNAKRSVTLLAKGTGTIEDVEILNDFITNYANMVESLEGFKNDYQKLLEWVKSQLERIDKTAQDEVKYEVRKELYNSFIADITKVLEGKK